MRRVLAAPFAALSYAAVYLGLALVVVAFKVGDVADRIGGWK